MSRREASVKQVGQMARFQEWESGAMSVADRTRPRWGPSAIGGVGVSDGGRQSMAASLGTAECEQGHARASKTQRHDVDRAHAGGGTCPGAIPFVLSGAVSAWGMSHRKPAPPGRREKGGRSGICRGRSKARPVVDDAACKMEDAVLMEY